MNRLKTVISVLSAAAVIAGCLAGCAKPPEEEAVTATTVYEMIREDGEPLSSEDGKSGSAFAETKSDVTFTISSYNVFNNNYAEIKNITIDSNSQTANASCYCDLDMIYIGHDSNKMRIAYVAYDASGSVVRDAFIQADVSNAKSGDTVEKVRFDIPYNTAKVVFSDFTGGQNEKS